MPLRQGVTTLTDDTKAIVAAQLTQAFIQGATSKPGELRIQPDTPDTLWGATGSMAHRVLTVYR